MTLLHVLLSSWQLLELSLELCVCPLLSMLLQGAPSSKCLLCGDEDGGHHTASGCPALKRMYINRHNKVGRLIMTRVLRGRKGAFVIQMDLGSTENCAEDGIMAHQSRNIPWELLPRGLKEAVQQAQGTTDKRPDGMLYKPRMETTQQSTG